MIVKWIIIKIRGPLSITVNPNINYRGFTGGLGIVGCEILLSYDVNFGNNTEKKINAIINNIDFSPRKEVEFLKFDFRKGVYGIGVSSLKKKIILEPGDTLFHFLFIIRGVKSFNKEDFKSCNDIPMVFKIEYSVSPRFQEIVCKIELKGFFEKANNLLRKNVWAWIYKNF